jgi:hypothetical protein
VAACRENCRAKFSLPASEWAGAEAFGSRIIVQASRARRTCSDFAPLDDPISTKVKKISYAVDYFQTSTFVHCSISAIDNYNAREEIPFEVSHSHQTYETGRLTLFTLLAYLHRSIAYVLFGINIDRPGSFDLLFHETLNVLNTMKHPSYT